ncbi:hypothetical protein ACIQMJ_03140 [Actinosynnema sp. NPDC091369]
MTSRPPRGFRALLGESKWPALVSGRVKVLGAQPDGGQLLITLRGPGDLLGQLAALLEQHEAPESARRVRERYGVEDWKTDGTPGPAEDDG